VTHPLSSARTERPVVVRGAILMFGLVIISTTIRTWSATPADPEVVVSPWPHVISLFLAASMVVQFFAKQRSSKFLSASIALILISLGLLWMYSAGHLGNAPA
jgi:hypothetical protein